MDFPFRTMTFIVLLVVLDGVFEEVYLPLEIVKLFQTMIFRLNTGIFIADLNQ